MKLPFFASFIIFILVLSHRIRRQRNEAAAKEKAFWDREQAANSVRRKPLDNLEYIHIPLDSLPTNLLNDNEEAADCINILNDLSTEKIVNFTGYTNTDLKLEYGTANIGLLSEYDQRYTILVTTLQKWADILWDAGYKKEAADVMEFAVSTRTDVSRTYRTLAQYYNETGHSEKIQGLINTANELHSVSKDSIVRTLQEACQ